MNFYDELANIFDEDKVTDETKFKQLDQWDSITLMTLQQSLQSCYEVTFVKYLFSDLDKTLFSV